MLSKIIEDKDVNRIFMRSRMLILSSGSLNAVFSIFILIIAARTISIEDTGILTIAFAIAKLLLNIGKFGMRNYQVTEKAEIKFSEWLMSRIITVMLMLMCSAGYVIFQMRFHGYSTKKALTVIIICILYATECIEDIYTGYYQRAGRLDISSYIQTIRWIAVIASFSIGLFLFHDMILASFVSIIFSLIIIYFCAIKNIHLFTTSDSSIRKNVIKKLLADCFPLFLMSFVLIYISNAAKYAIDNIYSSEVQAYFGFVSMPIFAISLFSGFIFQPYLAKLSSFWKDHNLTAFKQIVHRQFVYIGIMSVGCLVAGWFLGIPILSLLYGVQGLEEYKAIFMILLVGGIGTAVINFLSALLVIFRQQNAILLCHLIAGASLFISIKFLINSYGIIGASLGTMIWTWILALLLGILYMYKILKQ